MTKQEALTNIKNLADTAIKAGLFPNVESAALFHQTILFINQYLHEPDPGGYKQFQPVINDKKVGGGFEPADLP